MSGVCLSGSQDYQERVTIGQTHTKTHTQIRTDRRHTCESKQIGQTRIRCEFKQIFFAETNPDANRCCTVSKPPRTVNRTEASVPQYTVKWYIVSPLDIVTLLSLFVSHPLSFREGWWCSCCRASEWLTSHNMYWMDVFVYTWSPRSRIMVLKK